MCVGYKVKYPTKFHMLRGNHECSSICRLYGFYDEVKKRYNIRIWKIFTGKGEGDARLHSFLFPFLSYAFIR